MSSSLVVVACCRSSFTCPSSDTALDGRRVVVCLDRQQESSSTGGWLLVSTMMITLLVCLLLTPASPHSKMIMNCLARSCFRQCFVDFRELVEAAARMLDSCMRNTTRTDHSPAGATIFQSIVGTNSAFPNDAYKQ